MDLLLNLMLAYGVMVAVMTVIAIGCFGWFLWEIGKGAYEHWRVRNRRNRMRIV